MSAERLFERVSDFRKALERLQEALLQPETSLIRDATIQRFEFTYELAWKALKLMLDHRGIDTRNARDALREGLEQGLIEDGNGWTAMHEMRNLTSHTYDEAIAKQVYHFIQTEGVALFKVLERQFTVSGIK